MRQIIISHYEESLVWLQNILPYFHNDHSLSIYVYHKSPDHNIQLHPGPLHYPFIYRHQVPNEGREGSTYLMHLAKIAETKSVDTCIFLQANPFPHLLAACADIYSLSFLPNYLIRAFELQESGIFSPLAPRLSCDQRGLPHHNLGENLWLGWREIDHILGKYGFSMGQMPEWIDFVPGASLIVQASKLLAPPQLWLDINEWLLLDPINGYICERLWGYLLKAVTKITD